ncbi:hypothetical protein [Teredinibacter sp. KSP-S5-2]|uniref:hypothetical protein n=1 Tax=Teredinibacter sp. KSP-S5-2 TaxID=3034506 RepID=UPI0029347FCC|nr:hypothetical protein [Teredinibacter sp. KSP-S5-2]WNO11286.1 hypothetical protein P5V12_08890 [Teredinibacter sp. KSP-S5-2]
MSSIYFYCEAEFNDVISADNIEEQFEFLEDADFNGRFFILPRCLNGGSKNNCWVIEYESIGKILKFEVGCGGTEDEECFLNDLSLFLSEQNAVSCYIASYYSGADFDPLIYKWELGLLSLLNELSNSEEFDLWLEEDPDRNLKEVIELVKSGEVEFPDLQKEEDKEYELERKLFQLVQKLPTPTLFGETSISDDYLISSECLFKEEARDALKSVKLNRCQEKAIQDYISAVYEDGLQNAFRILSQAGCTIKNDDVLIDPFTPTIINKP